MTVSETFNKFLPNNFYEAIQHRFRDNPEELIQGVNYSFEGKIWNVRVGLNKDEEDVVTDLFIRAYCESEVKVYHFFNVQYVQNDLPDDRVKSIDFIEHIITSDSYGKSNGTTGETHVPSIIPSIIRNGVKEYSNLTPGLRPDVRPFLEGWFVNHQSWLANHQELIPPIHRPTSRRPETTPADRTSYFFPVAVGLVLFCITSVAAYLAYRSMESKSQPLNSAGTGAVA